MTHLPSTPDFIRTFSDTLGGKIIETKKLFPGLIPPGKKWYAFDWQQE